MQTHVFYWALMAIIAVAYFMPGPRTELAQAEIIYIEQDCAMDVEQALRKERILNKIIKLRPTIDRETANEIAIAVADVSLQNDVDPNLLLAIAWTESNLNPDARGNAGEYGLFQIMPTWANELSFVDHPEQLQEIETNVRAGGYIYTTYYGQLGNNKRLALTAYNRGLQNVKNDLHTGENPENGYAALVMVHYDMVRRY